MLKTTKENSFFKQYSNLVLLMLMMSFSTVYGNAIEINTSIQMGNDDVEERSSGRISSGSGDLEMIDDSDNQTIGLRFINLDIPQGASITNAYLQFTVDEIGSESTLLNIQGQSVGNAGVFTTTEGDVTSRSRTSASVSWSVPTWDTTKVSGSEQQTPELTEVVQEIINLSDWTNSNSMVFIIDGIGKRVADSYEGGSDRAPKLYIAYELNDGGTDDGGDDNVTDDNTTDDNTTNSNEIIIIDTAVSHDDDDAEELSNGDISTGSSDLELVYDGSDQTVGIRFTALNIPQGATVTNAYLQFTVDETDTENTLLNIYAEKSAIPAFYENVGFNITERTKTLASVSWDVPEWDVTLESGEKQRTPDLKSLIQEVVNLDTWNDNSNLAFIINGTGKRVVDSHEGGADRATKLHIEYTLGSVDDNTTNNNDDSNGTDDETDDATIDSGDDNNTTDGGDDSNTTDGGDGGTDDNTTNIGSITFTEDATLNQDNPDRGLFYGEYALNVDAGYNVFQSVQDKGYQLAYVTINLNDYRGSNTLPQSLFDNLAKNFTDAEETGVKMILRFKYRVDRDESLVDPSIEMIEAHMNQLKPFLLEHQDIISVVQAGTIGAWGEWNNFTGDFKDDDPDYKNNRKRVVDKLGELFPNKYIQMRTPMHKELIYGGSENYSDIASEAKITENIAFGSTLLARLGHHNDCIFADASDYGTYGTNDIEFWKSYVENDSKSAPVGGVSCGEMEEQYKTCEYALSYFKRLDYSFIMDNPSDHRVALHDQWKEEGCYTEIVNNLGYRLVAQNLAIGKEANSGNLEVNLSIENKGFASPHVSVDVSYVLKNSNEEHSFVQSDIDIRKFASNATSNINANLDLSAVPTGEYCLYLQLGVGFSAIRLSNSQNSEGSAIWNTNSKSNELTCGISIVNDNPTDDNTIDSGDDSNTTDDGTDDGGDDNNTTDGGDDDNVTDGGDSNQTLVAKTINLTISSGNNDVEESDTGSVYLDSSDLELVREGSDQTIGLRFTNLNIPQGATITSAYIQFNVDETGYSDTTLLDIYAHNSDNAPIFDTSTSNVTSREKTSASALWDIPVWDVLNEQGLDQQTPELKTLVQEVVNRSGWQESSAIAFIIQGIGKRVADSYEGGAEKAPKLHIEYEFYQEVVVYNPNKTTFIEDSLANILNPDRGLYSADYSLTEATDWNIFHDPQAEGYRIVYAPINLYDYTTTTTLPSSLLDIIDGHLTDAEGKGMKLILRFKYRPDASTSYRDPALSIIMGHMDQLRDILQSHKEIISVIQAGSIGAWGEWNRLTDEFSDTDSSYQSNRRAIIAKLSDIFPNKYIQIRTPMHKELLYGTSAEYKDEGIEGKITTELAFTDDIRAKVGHHNDCLMVDDTNYGTYGENVEFWKDYVANDAKYSAVGGETCGMESGFEYLTDCSNAVPELKRLQYSYLNNVYHQDVLDKWRDQGCYQEIKENLGYRLVATNLDTTTSEDHTTLAVSLAIDNKGFASPYVQSNVNLVLKNEQNFYSFPQADIDMRKFYADESNTINSNIPLGDVESGNYCLYLQIGENFSAIRLSNSQNSDGVDVWDDTLKMNTLKCGVEL